MKFLKFTCAAIALLTAVDAHAQMYPTGTFGNWQTLAGAGLPGPNTGSGRLCAAGIQTADRGFWVKKRDQNNLYLHLFKAGWQIPVGQQVDVTLQVDNAMPLSFHAVGIDTKNATSMGGLEIVIRPTDVTSITNNNAMTLITNLLSEGVQMKLWFPNGNEQMWTGSLAGSAAALATLGRCSATYFGTQPTASPTQPFDAPTQPYTPTASPIV